MQSNLDIRQAHRDDAATIIELAQKTFVETYGETNKKENVELYLSTMYNLDRLNAELINPHERFYIASYNGIPVGFTKMRNDRVGRGLEGKKAIEIERIYVLKEYQGFKVGKELLHKCREVASTEGYALIWLQVWQNNARALQFYQKGGFVIYETSTFQFGDELHDDYVMRYDLFT
jgi:diamine N-acetyltransferase